MLLLSKNYSAEGKNINTQNGTFVRYFSYIILWKNYEESVILEENKEGWKRRDDAARTI